MKKIVVNNITYEVLDDYKDGLNIEELTSKLTDYFEPYDYILGDWAYGKLRLKGFNDKSNKGFNNINNIKNKDNYIKNNCVFDCRYFLIRKTDDK